MGVLKREESEKSQKARQPIVIVRKIQPLEAESCREQVEYRSKIDCGPQYLTNKFQL